MTATRTITNPELTVGNVVRFHGARFEIVSTRIVPPNAHIEGDLPCMVAIGKWLDGEVVRGYFGPGKDWNFQGNARATVTIEI